MIGTRRRLWVGLWIGLVFAMVLMLSACAAGGADKGAAKAPTAKAHSANAHMAKSYIDEAHTDAANSAKIRPLPDPGTPPTPTDLSPGRYATNEFEPSVALSVGKGWAINNPEKIDHFSIYNRDFAKSDNEAGAVLTFVDVRAVFDPQSPTEGNVRSAPKDLLVWFQKHPRLDFSKPVPTTVGGLSAERFDASVSSLPKERLDECPDPLPIFGLQYQEPVSIVKRVQAADYPRGGPERRERGHHPLCPVRSVRFVPSKGPRGAEHRGVGRRVRISHLGLFTQPRRRLILRSRTSALQRSGKFGVGGPSLACLGDRPIGV